MKSHKLHLIKKIIEQQLSSFEFDKEISKQQTTLLDVSETPADEFSLSGNIKYGITNLVEATTGLSHTIGFLYSKKSALEEFLKLLDKDEEELNTVLKPNKPEPVTSWKDTLLTEFKTKPKTNKLHFLDCPLTTEKWGSENCICPGAYIYRKYLSKGLSKAEARLISDYSELGHLMEDKDHFTRGKALYTKHKFLNISSI